MTFAKCFLSFAIGVMLVAIVIVLVLPIDVVVRTADAQTPYPSPEVTVLPPPTATPLPGTSELPVVRVERLQELDAAPGEIYILYDPVYNVARIWCGDGLFCALMEDK